MEIYIPQPAAEILLQIAAEREISVEKLFNAVIKKYMETECQSVVQLGEKFQIVITSTVPAKALPAQLLLRKLK